MIAGRAVPIEKALSVERSGVVDPEMSLAVFLTHNGKRAYAHAIAERYRFYSYGDACLLLGADRSRAGSSQAECASGVL